MSAAASSLARLRRVRDQHATAVRWLDLLGPLLLVMLLVAAWQARPAPGVTGRALVVGIAVVVFAAAVLARTATARRRSTAAHRAAVALLLAASITLTVAQPHGPGAECVLLALLCLAVLLPESVAAVVLVIGFALTGVLSWTLARDGVALVVLAAVAALYGLLFLAFRLVAANREAERMLVELERGRAAQVQAAGLAERQRLAREMHDVLAHSLSGLMLQLEGARLMAEADPGDPRLLGALERAHQLGHSGLTEARQAIETLRDDELPGPERLPSLAARFEQDRQVPCTVTTTGMAYDLPVDARVALYRVAQEALTNVTKHAHADAVTIALDYGPQATRLVVEDVGRPAGTAVSSGGYGLTGMRERAELAGGTLRAAPTAHGFRVELVVAREAS